MDALDYRAQQELEEERLCSLLAILDRVASGNTNINDARDLAGELGLSRYWSDHEQLKNTAVEREHV